MKILVCAPVEEAALKVVEDNNIIVNFLSEDDYLERIIGFYNGLIADSDLILDKKILIGAKNLEVIGILDKDMVNIDLDIATKMGIAVINASDGLSASIAEYTMLLMLNLARQNDLGMELKGRTLGIIGLGNVGAQVAKRAKAFDMSIIAYDPNTSKARATLHDVQMGTLADVLASSDFISLHLPVNEQTRGIIDAQAVAAMKQNACLINTQDAALCDVDALSEALNTGKLGGCAFDVTDDSALSALKAHPRVFFSNHRACATKEAKFGAAAEIAGEITAFLRQRYSKNVVNMPLIKESQRDDMAPYFALVELLARCLNQLNGSPREIKMICRNELTLMDIEPLCRMALATLLDRGNKVNYVNAAFLAENKGITVITQKSYDDGPDFSIEIIGIGHNNCIAGDLTASGPRLKMLDHFAFDIVPPQYFLIVPHANRPGMVGIVGTILGRGGVNISGMTISQRQDSAKAMMLVAVDNYVGIQTISEIQAQQGIDIVHSVILD